MKIYIYSTCFSFYTNKVYSIIRVSNLAGTNLLNVKNGNTKAICEFFVLHDSFRFVFFSLI